MTFYENELFAKEPMRTCENCAQPFWKPCRLYWTIVAPIIGGKLLHCATAFGYKERDEKKIG